MFKEGDIVLVMRKKVEWPATILSVQEGEAEVRIFNKADTEMTVGLDQIRSFEPDKKMKSGQSHSLNAAFKKAIKVKKTQN